MLAGCKEMTIASVNADGYPRPVPKAKICTKGCNEIWTATGADSVKATDITKVAYSVPKVMR